MPLALFFFFKIALAILTLLWSHTNLRTVCSISVKNVIRILIVITLDHRLFWVVKTFYLYIF